MNLREEIEAYHRENFDDTPEWTAKVILKMVEKRIDAMIENIVSTDGMDVPHVFHVDGYRNALLDVKEMISK